MKLAAASAVAEAPIEGGERHIVAVPRVSIQAFCETADLAGSMQAAIGDRRMAKAHVKVQMGGMIAALEAYKSAATPNVLIIEHLGSGIDLIAGLDNLASV